MLIIYIDYASEGNSGFYSARILESYNREVPLVAYLHNRYSYGVNNRKVFKIFDCFSRFIKFRTGKLVIKYFDIYICFSIILILLKIKSINNKLIIILNFHQSFHAYKFFSRLVGKFAKVFIVVHDAVELQHKYPKQIMSDRDEVLKSADALLVHGNDSINKLKYLSKKIYKIPFPIKIDKNSIFNQKAFGSKIKFLFIGHIRPEKGLDILLKAWKSLSADYLSLAKLQIAGTNNSREPYDFRNIENCETLIRYLDDEDFIKLILECDYVVMPYTGGTNSGILSVAASLNRPCITSNIPVFLESIFSIPELTFTQENSLANCIESAITNHAVRYNDIRRNLETKCNHYNIKYDNDMNLFFENLTNEYK